jgi:hypothetical protein
VQGISIDWYPETGTFMLYAAVSATRNLKKATNRSDTQNGKSSKGIKLSWYQSIDKNHLCFYVKFKSRIFIPFAKKMRFKKRGTWPKGMGLSFFQMAEFTNTIFALSTKPGWFDWPVNWPDPERSVETRGERADLLFHSISCIRAHAEVSSRGWHKTLPRFLPGHPFK